MNLRSENVLRGAERAPNRSLFYAMGYTKEEIERPLIAVVSAHSEIVPGHIHLDKITEAVKAGVRMAGGTPVMVPAIGVCDGIAMGHVGMKYSLASRELIADSVETMIMAHGFDGAVLVPNCDKIVPGMIMAAVRLNIPAVVCSGGPMMSGLIDGVETSLSKMFEAVGARKANMIDDCKLLEFEENVCPGCGSCSGMYTANSMNCLAEAVGIALPGNGTIPAVHSGRIQLAKHASGPSHAEEVSRNKLSYLTVACKDVENANIIGKMFGSNAVRIRHSEDIYGIEYSAILKNIYALAAGIAAGLGYGDNFIAVLAAACAREMTRFINDSYPFERDTMDPAYMGDLLVTSYSNFSRNRRLGQLIGHGCTVKSALNEMTMVAEGYYAADCIRHINERHQIPMPIADMVYDVLYKKASPRKRMKELTYLL